MTQSNEFSYNTHQAKIQGLSVQVGDMFADIYKDEGPSSSRSMDALEAYKSLRRLLPRQSDWDNQSAHVGSTAAHKATQGMGC